jgi:hypothetical protein
VKLRMFGQGPRVRLASTARRVAMAETKSAEVQSHDICRDIWHGGRQSFVSSGAVPANDLSVSLPTEVVVPVGLPRWIREVKPADLVLHAPGFTLRP